jgi:hypothetical protein
VNLAGKRDEFESFVRFNGTVRHMDADGQPDLRGRISADPVDFVGIDVGLYHIIHAETAKRHMHQNDVVRHGRKRDTILRPAWKAEGGKVGSSAVSDTLTGVAQWENART